MIVKSTTTHINKFADLLTEFSKNGVLIEFAGKSHSGKTLLLHIISSLNALKNKKTIYVDSVGSFNPELIYNYLASTGLSNDHVSKKMKNITHARSYEKIDLLKILQKLRILDYSCIVFDDLLTYYSYQHERDSKYEVRRMVKDIALLSLLKRVCVVFTNPIVVLPNNKFLLGSTFELRYNEITRYIHVKANITIGTQNEIVCEFIRPVKMNGIRLIITKNETNYL